MNSEETIKILDNLSISAFLNYTFEEQIDAIRKAIECIRKVNEVERWLDPDIDSEKALEKIREIIYG